MPHSPLVFQAPSVKLLNKLINKYSFISITHQPSLHIVANFLPLRHFLQSFSHNRGFIGAGGDSVTVNLQHLSYLAQQIRAQQIDMHGRRYAQASLECDLVCINRDGPHPPAPTTPTPFLFR